MRADVLTKRESAQVGPMCKNEDTVAARGGDTLVRVRCHSPGWHHEYVTGVLLLLQLVLDDSDAEFVKVRLLTTRETTTTVDSEGKRTFVRGRVRSLVPTSPTHRDTPTRVYISHEPSNGAGGDEKGGHGQRYRLCTEEISRNFVAGGPYGVPPVSQ